MKESTFKKQVIARNFCDYGRKTIANLFTSAQEDRMRWYEEVGHNTADSKLHEFWKTWLVEEEWDKPSTPTDLIQIIISSANAKNYEDPLAFAESLSQDSKDFLNSVYVYLLNQFVKEEIEKNPKIDVVTGRGKEIYDKYAKVLEKDHQNPGYRDSNKAFEKFQKVVHENIHLFGENFISFRDDDYGQLFEDTKRSMLDYIRMPSIVIQNENFSFRFIPDGKREVIFTKFWASNHTQFNERAEVIRKVMGILIGLCRKYNIDLYDDKDESYEIYKKIKAILSADKEGFVRITRNLLE